MSTPCQRCARASPRSGRTGAPYGSRCSAPPRCCSPPARTSSAAATTFTWRTRPDCTRARPGRCAADGTSMQNRCTCRRPRSAAILAAPGVHGGRRAARLRASRSCSRGTPARCRLRDARPVRHADDADVTADRAASWPMILLTRRRPPPPPGCSARGEAWLWRTAEQVDPSVRRDDLTGVWPTTVISLVIPGSVRVDSARVRSRGATRAAGEPLNHPK